MAMSRTCFWTILLGTEPTAFRASHMDTLVPTLKQLQRRHPEAVIKWFDRGQLFASPEEADLARAAAAPERRPRDWRPGGDHRDPRARFEVSRDEKRRRFKMQQRRDRTAGGPPAAPRADARGPRRPDTARPSGSSLPRPAGSFPTRPAGSFPTRPARPRKPRGD